MRKRKVHKANVVDGMDFVVAVCGRLISVKQTTPRWKQVTCLNCLKHRPKEKTK